MSLFQALWDLIYSALVAAVSLQWGSLVQIGEDFVDWFWTWWQQIDFLIDDVHDRINYTLTTLQGRLNSVWFQVLDLLDLAEDYMLEQVQAVIDWVQATLADLSDYVAPLIDSVKAWVLDLLATWLDAALEFISPYIEAAKAWVTETFGWLLDSYTLFTEWLAGVRDAVTWLATYAWTSLTSFLTDPWGFVLGQLGATIIDTVNWWLAWSEPLSNFLTQDLPVLRNLIAQGLAFLQTFADNPLQMILDLLYPVFLDWLENLIEEAW